jgi:hypothetical protein
MNRFKAARAFLSLSIPFVIGYWLIEAGGIEAQGSAAFSFSNITDRSGYISLRNFGGHGVQAVDATGDGLIDIYVTNIADPKVDRRELFFVNQGGGQFNEMAIEAGVEDDGFFRGNSEESHAAVFADFDNDGDYDLFNAHTWTGNSRLYRNDGQGRFVDLTESAGIQVLDLESRAVAAGDINKDGRVDIILSAWEGQRNVVYLNRGSFHFRREDATGLDGRDLSNQGITLTDYDGDNDLDLASTGWKAFDQPFGPIALYKNRGNGTFTESTREAGVVFKEDTPGNGWSFGDLDNDGDLDAVIVGNDRAKLYLNQGKGQFEFAERFGRGDFTAALGDLDHDGDLDIYFGGNQAIYRNKGQGRFERVEVAGIRGIGANPRAVSLADIDNDGDLDILLVSKRGRNTLFRNNLDDDNWLQVRLRSPSGEAGAYGAKVSVYDAGHLGDPEHLIGFREARSATGYCAQDSPIIHFGLPAHETYDVRVRFLNGKVVNRPGISPTQILFVDGTSP